MDRKALLDKREHDRLEGDSNLAALLRRNPQAGDYLVITRDDLDYLLAERANGIRLETALTLIEATIGQWVSMGSRPGDFHTEAREAGLPIPIPSSTLAAWIRAVLEKEVSPTIGRAARDE
jgi:hypothetical protein